MRLLSAAHALFRNSVDEETCRGFGGHHSTSTETKTCMVQSSELRLTSINIEKLKNLPE